MKNLQKGQLLIEAIVAITLVGIIITGIVTALVFSVNNSATSKDQNLATQYAQEGLDVARNLKDSNFSTFSTLSGNYYLPDGYIDISSSNPSDPISGKFTRVIYINQTGKDFNNVTRCTNSPSAYVNSTVRWSDNTCRGSGNCHSVQLQSCLTDPSKVLY